jgi:hypothetical protein
MRGPLRFVLSTLAVFVYLFDRSGNFTRLVDTDLFN